MEIHLWPGVQPFKQSGCSKHYQDEQEHAMSCVCLPLGNTPLEQPRLVDIVNVKEHLQHHTNTGMPRNRTLKISHLKYFGAKNIHMYILTKIGYYKIFFQ